MFRLDNHVAGVIRDLEVFLGVAQTPSQFPTGMPSLTELTDALPSFWPFASLLFPLFTAPKTRLFSLYHSIFRKLVQLWLRSVPFLQRRSDVFHVHVHRDTLLVSVSKANKLSFVLVLSVKLMNGLT